MGCSQQRRGLKPFEGRCTGCGKVISSKAPNCGRRTCSAVYPKWSRDQRRVTAEALREYGGLLLLTDVTLPGTPEQERHRRNVAIPWGADRRGEAKALYKANRRFKLRMRWLKRKAYNDARSVLRKAGYEFERLPPVLVGNLEVQKRGALHAHMALPYTTPLEMTFSRAFVDAMKRWAPLCGLGYVQGWKAAERSKVYGHEKGDRIPDEVLDWETPARVPADDQRAGADRLSFADPADRRDDGGASEGAAAVVCAGNRCPMPDWSAEEFAAVAKLLDRRPASTRAP